jgi:hypothetical protein
MELHVISLDVVSAAAAQTSSVDVLVVDEARRIDHRRLSAPSARATE